MKWILRVLIFFLIITPCSAAWVLKWDPNTEEDLAGYRIYYGAASGAYTQSVDVGNVTEWTIPDSLTSGYFAATAYDTDSFESGYSNEVPLNVGQLAPEIATGLNVIWKRDIPMAIDFPVAATSDYVTGDTDTEIVVTPPSGIANGDLLIAWGKCVESRSISAPAGWTALFNHSVTGYLRHQCWFKKASSESGNYTFTVGTFSAAGVVILRVTGAVCDSSGDFTVQTGGNLDNDLTSNCPDITTPENNTVVLWSEIGSSGEASSCDRGGATERLDVTYHISVWSEPIATAATVTGAVITRTNYGRSTTGAIAIKTASAGGSLAIAILMQQYRNRR